MAYSDKVVDHYNNPRNVGSLPKKDPNVGTGLVGEPKLRGQPQRSLQGGPGVGQLAAEVVDGLAVGPDHADDEHGGAGKPPLEQLIAAH